MNRNIRFKAGIKTVYKKKSQKKVTYCQRGEINNYLFKLNLNYNNSSYCKL